MFQMAHWIPPRLLPRQPISWPPQLPPQAYKELPAPLCDLLAAFTKKVQREGEITDSLLPLLWLRSHLLDLPPFVAKSQGVEGPQLFFWFLDSGGGGLPSIWTGLYRDFHLRMYLLNWGSKKKKKVKDSSSFALGGGDSRVCTM